jgi:hypothetical protein
MLPRPPSRSGGSPDRVLLAQASAPSRERAPVPVPVAEPPRLAANVSIESHGARPGRDPIGNLLADDVDVQPVPRTELAFATGTPRTRTRYVAVPMPAPRDVGNRSPRVARIDTSFRTVDSPASLLRPTISGDEGSSLSSLY